MDAVMKESSLSKLSELVEVESHAIYSKVGPNPATFPLWCKHREEQNAKSSAHLSNIRNFDSIIENSEKTLEEGQT